MQMTEKILINTDPIAVLNRLSHAAFLNFCSTFLYTLGLTQVQASLSEDGIVSGDAVIELGSFAPYRISFLAKQHSGTLPDGLIVAARETMDLSTNKGLVLTSGGFSREAKRLSKAKREIPFDLIDADGLVRRLQALRLGISYQTGEVYRLTDNKYNER